MANSPNTSPLVRVRRSWPAWVTMSSPATGREGQRELLYTEVCRISNIFFYILLFSNQGFSYQQRALKHQSTSTHTPPPATIYMLSPSEPSVMTSSPGLKLDTAKRSTIMAVCSSSRRLRKSFFWMALTIRLVSLVMKGERSHVDLRSVEVLGSSHAACKQVIHYIDV